jgi:hypothetical protein
MLYEFATLSFHSALANMSQHHLGGIVVRPATDANAATIAATMPQVGVTRTHTFLRRNS